jgi:hypothetical protein
MVAMEAVEDEEVSTFEIAAVKAAFEIAVVEAAFEIAVVKAA